MATAQNLIDAALRKIGRLASGESPTSQEGTDALAELNRLISSWNNDELYIHATTIDATQTLTADQESYTIGSGGDLAITRPQEIHAVNILDTSGEDIERRLNIRDKYWWANDRPADATSSLPRDVYYNPTYGASALGTLYLSPTPDAAYYIEIHSWGLLGSIAAVGTTIALPPGYEDLIVYGLAVRLYDEYGGTADLGKLIRTLSIIERRIRLKNSTATVLQSDYPCTGGREVDILSEPY